MKKSTWFVVLIAGIVIMAWAYPKFISPAQGYTQDVEPYIKVRYADNTERTLKYEETVLTVIGLQRLTVKDLSEGGKEIVEVNTLLPIAFTFRGEDLKFFSVSGSLDVLVGDSRVWGETFSNAGPRASKTVYAFHSTSISSTQIEEWVGADGDFTLKFQYVFQILDEFENKKIGAYQLSLDIAVNREWEAEVVAGDGTANEGAVQDPWTTPLTGDTQTDLTNIQQDFGLNPEDTYIAETVRISKSVEQTGSLPSDVTYEGAPTTGTTNMQQYGTVITDSSGNVHVYGWSEDAQGNIEVMTQEGWMDYDEAVAAGYR